MAKNRTIKGAKALALNPNPEKPISAKKTLGLESKTKAVGSAETNQDALSLAVSQKGKIALLAYTYWIQRGCQSGSPEENWFRAEEQINPVSSGPFTGN